VLKVFHRGGTQPHLSKILYSFLGVLSLNSSLWESVKGNLKAKNSGNKLIQTWFDPMELLSIEPTDKGSKFRLGVPSDLHKYWITENFFDRLCSEISAQHKNPFYIEFVITGKTSSDSESAQLELAFKEMPDTQEALAKKPLISNNSSFTDSLNRDYTFSTFVVGRNSEFAHASSFNIAQNPGTDGYNPLFICGPTGMGKTHLLNAVGNHIRGTFPNLRICYVSAERFLNECISSIRRNEMDKFRLKYRDRCDILLVDDIHILGKTEAVQEEFFHTLNDLFERKRQVIVASDKMPREIKGLEDRIRTRLEWGLIADIQMPDLETRVAILRYKAERRSIKVPEDVISYISRVSKRSIRELEGNLTRVKMYAELRGLEINPALAKEVLGPNEERTDLTTDEIQRLTAEHFRIRLVDLKSKSRARPIVTARHVCMYLIKKYLNKSLTEIGRVFGGKDHTTVIHALQRIEDQQQTNPELRNDIEELERIIQNITGV